MKKQLFGLALAAAWMGSNTAWAQVPATPAAPATTAAPTATAPDPATPALPAAPRRGNQVQGRVTAMDTVKKTVTVLERRTGTSTTLTLAPDAKVLMAQPAALSDIKSGSLVAAYGDVTPGATTVTATRLVILPADTKQPKPRPNAGYHRTYVQGTVANTSPLTMTTPGGVTVTVTTASDTAVTKTVPGTASDITVGATIQARTSGDVASPTATEVRIMPTNAGRFAPANAGRRGRRQRPTTPDTPAVAAPAPAP